MAEVEFKHRYKNAPRKGRSHSLRTEKCVFVPLMSKPGPHLRWEVAHRWCKYIITGEWMGERTIKTKSSWTESLAGKIVGKFHCHLLVVLFICLKEAFPFYLSSKDPAEENEQCK